MGTANTSIWVALRDNRLDELSAIVKENPSLVNSHTNDDGSTPLHMAAYWGNASAASIILSSGAQVDARDREANTPLMEAAKRLELVVLRLLLANGADLNAENAQGVTPLRALVARMNGRDLGKKFNSAQRAAEEIAEILTPHIQASFTKAAESAILKRVAFVELPEPGFHWFFVRFLDPLSDGKSKVTATLTEKQVKVMGVADHDDLAIMMPQSDAAVVSCRRYLKEVAAEALCPLNADPGFIGGLLLRI